MQCARCQADNPDGARFCNACGSPLAAGAPLLPGRPPQARRSGAEIVGERKQVTVLFADVKGSMELAESVDAEDWRSVMGRFFTLLSEGVHRFEGTVDKFTGDGIMALFGAPIAHEDHAERACYSALHLLNRLREYADEVRREQGLNFAVRVGLNSGEVIVGPIGEDLHVAHTAVGHTVGLTQRMEALAEPGTAYMTEHTARLLKGRFETHDLGEFDLKGASRSLRVFRLEGVGAARSRLEAASGRGLSRFVGREEELAELEAAFTRSAQGSGEAIGIVADAGVGKSRLCHEFLERCRSRGVRVYRTGGVAHGQAVPFLVMLDFLRGYFGVSDGDSEQAVRETIAGRLMLLEEDFSEALPLFFDFLGVTDSQRPVPNLDPEARHRRLLLALRRLVALRSRDEPGVIVLEDLHWIDSGSQAFVDNLVEALPESRMLVVVNFRPGYRSPWVGKPYYSQLALEPLGPALAAGLLTELLGTHPSLKGLSERVHERTRGNPFFIEEVVHELAENGMIGGETGDYRLSGSLERVTIPATVQALLAARIDRLDEREKTVLQTASVIGREFSEGVLSRVVDAEPSRLQAALGSLVEAELLFQHAFYPIAEYAFKHPLTQEIAYRTQLSERRRIVHRAVARALVEVEADRLDERSALISQHLEQGHEPLEAARWSGRAAAWAGPHHAVEALEHWRKVRWLCARAGHSAEAQDLAADACLRILVLDWRAAITDDEAAAVYEEGRALAERRDDARLLANLGVFHALSKGFTGDCRGALELTLQAAELADRSEDLEVRVGAYAGASFWHYVEGDQAAALRWAERGLRLAGDRLDLGQDVYGFGLAPFLHMLRGIALAFLGRPGEGLHELETGVELCRVHDEIEVLGWTQSAYVIVSPLTEYVTDPVAHARHSIEIAERLGSSYSRILARASLGRVLVAEGQWAEAIETLESTLELALRKRTSLQQHSGILSLLAEARLGEGDAEAARSLAEEALALAPVIGSRLHEIQARRALALVLIRAEGVAGADAAADALAGALDLIDATGMKAFVPQIRLVQAELAWLQDDADAQRHHLMQAQEALREMGSHARAERLGQLLAAETAAT